MGAKVEGCNSLVVGGGGCGGVGFPAGCFSVAGVEDNVFGGHSVFPIEVLEAVLTTAAIEGAFTPFRGFSVVDMPSDAASSDMRTGMHFSCNTNHQ